MLGNTCKSLNGLYVFVQNTYLGCFLLEGHEVQICDVDHVRSSHHRQHPVLHLPGQGTDIQQLPQLGFLNITHKKVDQAYNSQTTEVVTTEGLGYSFGMKMTKVRQEVPEFGVNAVFCD